MLFGVWPFINIIIIVLCVYGSAHTGPKHYDQFICVCTRVAV